MKSTLVSAALALTVAEAQWTENVYGRRTNSSKNGSSGSTNDQNSYRDTSSFQNGNYDDWGTRQPGGASGWGTSYSSEQQPRLFRPQVVPILAAPPTPIQTQKPYVKVPLPFGPVAAAAEMYSEEARGLLVLNQNNDEAVKVMIRLAGLLPKTEYDLRIGEYGNILSDCTMTGEVFNPLTPDPIPQYDHWGRITMIQPESDGRGEFESVVAGDEGEVSRDAVELMQNLSGDDTLIGKSIVVYEKDDNVPVMCGVIGHGLPEAEILTFEDD